MGTLTKGMGLGGESISSCKNGAIQGMQYPQTHQKKGILTDVQNEILQAKGKSRFTFVSFDLGWLGDYRARAESLTTQLQDTIYKGGIFWSPLTPNCVLLPKENDGWMPIFSFWSQYSHP